LTKDQYPSLLISNTIDRLQTTRYYTKLDIKDVYHKMQIRKGEEGKIPFGMRYELFEYTVMPAGLANAPGTFQR
jgi:hypothetical protein